MIDRFLMVLLLEVLGLVAVIMLTVANLWPLALLVGVLMFAVVWAEFQ